MLKDETDTLTQDIHQTAEKYSDQAFMYIEYPHKSFWSPDFSGEDAAAELLKMRDAPAPSMLYVHLPFCEKLCYFCTCHTEITGDYGRLEAYLPLLYREIDLYRRFFEENGIEPSFAEVHLGGGSPTMLREPEFDALVAKIDALVDIASLREFAIEIDPRFTDVERLRYYHGKGINRISLGVQEFEPRVQEAINRVQPRELIDPLLAPDVRGLFAHGVNFDVLCGLPHQTPESIRKTFDVIAEMAPDRICLNHLHYAPETARHQTLMVDGKQGRPTRLPDHAEKKAIFREAYKALSAHGYVRTGYDHFAKPGDGVARALSENKMKWNALGVTTGDYTNVLGVGPHSTSTLADAYYQNVYGTKAYADRIETGEFPVFRGTVLSRDDQIRREVIQKIRNFSKVSFADIESKYQINFHEYFSLEIELLGEMCRDGLVEVRTQGLEVTELGREFVLFVCSQFDAYRD